MQRPKHRIFVELALSSFLIVGFATPQSPNAGPTHYPWSDKSLSADQRADLVIKEMTLDEKIMLLHGQGMPFSATGPTESNGGAGYSKSIPRLGIPAIQMADSAYGVTRGAAAGRYSTALPNNLAAASSWDPGLALQYGSFIGSELRNQGYSMSLGGGVNLTREPRNGRTFEYQGEDPLLAGTMVGFLAKGVQSEHIIGDLKHYAVNDQESGRNAVNANIDKRSMRESDLLAFQIALHISDAGAVMCSYNRVNGDYACENEYLLKDILKGAFNFKGFVVSDWGGTHSTAKASHAGLDQEQPNGHFFNEELKKAVEGGEVSQEELNDHVHRILRTIFATGLFDEPVVRQVPDIQRGLDFAQYVAENSIVLLKNQNSVLPLKPAELHSVVLIGGHADKGVLTGGGSAQVDPPGGSPVSSIAQGEGFESMFRRQQWLPSSPLRALQDQMSSNVVSYVSGEDLASAASAAKASDVAVVFAYQWESEGADLPTLRLSDDQEKLIETVAAVNPRTIVVLETGSPVTMPWIDKVAGVIEAWYPGIRGGEALAEILIGKVNPTAKLAITFPKYDSDLPHPAIVMPPPESLPPRRAGMEGASFMASMAKGLPPFQVYYDEKLNVGYKWYDAMEKPVLFPFGFGLSYSTFEYSDLEIVRGTTTSVTFSLKNVSAVAGTEIAEIYASLPPQAGEPPKRLIGWSRVKLLPGESQRVSVSITDDRLEIYDEGEEAWRLIPGNYTIRVGRSSQGLPLNKSFRLQ